MKLSEICKQIEDEIVRLEKERGDIPILQEIEVDIVKQLMRISKGSENPHKLKELIGDIYYRMY